MLCTDIAGKVLLEGGNLGAHDVLAMIQDGLNVRLNFSPNPFLLIYKIDKFHQLDTLV